MTTYTYYENGQLATMTDGCGNTTCSDMTGAATHKTTYVYTDAPASGNAAGNSNAYLTSITDALGHVRSLSYNYTSGKLATTTDAYLSGGSASTTNYSYNTQAPQCTTPADTMDRLTEIAYPDGGITSYCYNDSTPSITTNQLINGSTWKSTVSTMDGLGHVIGTELTTDPAGPTYTATSYTGLGQVLKVWNPSRCNPLTQSSCSGESTWGYTSYLYDSLGRKTKQINSDTTSESWSYSGSTVSFTDESLTNVWQRTSDSLGRLTNVLEPNGAKTYYLYDLLDNLTCAAQDGGAGGGFSSCASTPAAWRPRSFSYDSLSRLVSSFNPETGWTCYGTSGGAPPNGSNCTAGYDANGNLAAKTDARNITASYSYDELNRLLSRRFSNDPAGTPTFCYQYDSATLGVGRLANEWSQSASAGACAATVPTTGLWTRRSILTYDAMGRVQSEQQCTPSNCASSTPYSLAYAFDKAGNQNTATNGITSTPVVGTLSFTSTFDPADRLLSMSSNWNDPTHPASLFSAQTVAGPCTKTVSAPYAAFGGLLNASYGANLTLSRGYDVRLRTTCETDTGSLLNSSTNASATVTVTGTEQSQ